MAAEGCPASGAQSSRASSSQGPFLDDKLPTIFVSIPSYRDPECQYTVIDLYQKAKNPQRVYVGICWQADCEEDAHCFLLDSPAEFAPQVRTLHLHHSEARGPCYARALIEQKLFQGEDFILQLDSHYRMAELWDEELLRQLKLCASSKPILTTYPSSYTLPEEYSPGGPDRARLNPQTHPIVMCARCFGEADGFLRSFGKMVLSHSLGGVPPPSLFWAAGFAFSSSAVISEVPYDLSLQDLFFGEEPSMAARLWTSGWDFFSPTKVIGYHLWTRKHRPVFREHACEDQRKREASSQDKVRRLLGSASADSPPVADFAVDGYGLGSARSLAEYEAFSGVSFARREASSHARRGGHRATTFVDGDPAAEDGGPGAGGAIPHSILSMLQGFDGGRNCTAEQAVPELPLQARPSQEAEAGSTSPAPHQDAPPPSTCSQAARTMGAAPAAASVPILGLMPDQVVMTVSALLGTSGDDGAAVPPTRLGGGPNLATSSKPPALLRLPSEGRSALDILLMEEVRSLNDRGFVVVDGFLRDRCYPRLLRSFGGGGASHAALKAAAEAPRIARAGATQVPLRPAGLGTGDRMWSSSAVRGDDMTWLSAPQGAAFGERAARRVFGCVLDASSADVPPVAPGGPFPPTGAQISEFDALSSQLQAAFGGPPAAIVPTGSGYPGATGSEAADDFGDCSGHSREAEGEHSPFYEDLDVLLSQLVQLRTELDEVLSFNSSRMSLMLARYPGGGAHYARHLDAHPDKPGVQRRLTAVYYLNPSWTPADGGCLRAYLPEEIGKQVAGARQMDGGVWALDIHPLMDRLVIFSSQWLEHEVLPAHAERLAVTAWLY